MRSTENWGQRVDPEFYETIEPRERDRQEAMNEVTYGEEQYLKDLEIMHEVLKKKETDRNVYRVPFIFIFVKKKRG